MTTHACRNKGGRELKKYSATLTASGVSELRFADLIPATSVGIKEGAVVCLTVRCPVGSPITLLTGTIQKYAPGGAPEDNGIDAWIATPGGGNLTDGDYTATAVIVAP